ncbi:MAG: cytochrome c family protein [Bdellovibrionales bacterium]|nr:cytochrome c family protein [Bdellovibrionales bacterium]
MIKKMVGLAALVVVFGGLTTLVYALISNKVTVGYNQGYAPEQPIPFPHDIHAGQYKIDCKYCHAQVEVSRHATVPSLNVCMNCHLGVKVRPEAQKWIDQITAAYNSGKSIAWQKVHLLPDFVKFNHAPHIKAGKACQECHGPVETMKVMTQQESLSMGWCVNCHRQPENNAPLNCSTCHY